MDLLMLEQIAADMVAQGKGILAMDESHSTCGKRFASVNVECTPETRRGYRQMIITTPGVEEYISGMILFDETLRQKTDDGTPFPEALSKKGILPGIKVDTGAKELALFPGEKVTEGLDGLRDRLKEYATLGAKFAKWRAVIAIGSDMPSEACVTANCHALARYAALCQEAGIVPMVEPEVIFDGQHDIDTCFEVSSFALRTLFNTMIDQGVALSATILKTSMILAGKQSGEQSSPEEVAVATVECFMENVPATVPGIVFLSGGQSNTNSTLHLDMINKIHTEKPWPISFSYGRAIQSEALKVWAADPQKNIQAAQAEIIARTKDNSLASLGEWNV
jgi:fructose-bisphosphate aldolase class I